MSTSSQHQEAMKELNKEESPPEEEVEEEERMPELTDEDKAEFKAGFKAFQSDDKTLPNDKIGRCLREMGLMPTNAQITRIMDEADPERMGWIDLDGFLESMRRVITYHKPQEEDIRAAFRVFDKENNGFLPTAMMRHILTNLGESLDEEELDCLMKYCDNQDSGQIKYEIVLDAMFNPNPKAMEKLLG